MKKIFIFIGLLFLTIALWRQWENSPVPQTLPSSKPSLETSLNPTLPQLFDYQMGGEKFRLAWFLADPQKLKLIANYREKRTASEFRESEHCQNLTSAGFYAEDGSPLGLVVVDGRKLHEYEKNILFNGVFSVSKDGLPQITAQTVNVPQLALQAGPLLVTNGQTIPLTIGNDKPSRRIVVGITSDNKLIFLVFYKEDNPYQGPLLTDLSQHLKELQTRSGIAVSTALNLDGGSASAFASGGLFLEELTTVGSFFCSR